MDPNIQNLHEEYRMQETLQQQQMQGQQIMSTPYVYEQVQQHQSALVEQTNPSKVIDEIVLSLQGIERRDDGNGGFIFKKVSEPVMNQIGVNRIRFIMRGVINQNTILSHLEDREISKLVLQLGDDLIDDLTLNWKDYEIKDKILLDHIVDSILFPSFFALKRAWGQNEKNWLGKISVENISNAPKIPNKKEGILSRLKL